MMCAGRGACVRHENNFRFQALRAMHGHDAHFIAPLVHVAFDFRARLPHPVQKPLHGGGVVALILKRQIEKLIHGIVRVAPEPRENFMPPAFLAQHMSEEFIRRFEIRTIKKPR